MRVGASEGTGAAASVCLCVRACVREVGVGANKMGACIAAHTALTVPASATARLPCVSSHARLANVVQPHLRQTETVIQGWLYHAGMAKQVKQDLIHQLRSGCGCGERVARTRSHSQQDSV